MVLLMAGKRKGVDGQVSRVGVNFRATSWGDLVIFNKFLAVIVFYAGVFCICFGPLLCFAFFYCFAFRRCLTAGCVFRLVAEMGGFGSFIASVFIAIFLLSKISRTILEKSRKRGFSGWQFILLSFLFDTYCFTRDHILQFCDMLLSLLSFFMFSSLAFCLLLG